MNTTFCKPFLVATLLLLMSFSIFEVKSHEAIISSLDLPVTFFAYRGNYFKIGDRVFGILGNGAQITVISIGAINAGDLMCFFVPININYVYSGLVFLVLILILFVYALIYRKNDFKETEKQGRS